jgi:hypothetical protein
LLFLAEALARIRCWSAAIDAELVFPTSEGRPDFRALQRPSVIARDTTSSQFLPSISCATMARTFGRSPSLTAG